MRPVVAPEPKHGLVRRAVFLAWFTIGYNLLEGVVSIALGVKSESIALAGFGADSLIEVASAVLILWRFRGEVNVGSAISIGRERRATFGIGILFLLLAVMTALTSFFQFQAGSHPITTLPGLIISILSLSFMYFLWSAKCNVAIQLDSASMMKDAACSLACIKLSVVLFVGSLVFVGFPTLWWADSGAALILAVLIGKEGFETVRAALHPEFSGGCGCHTNDMSSTIQ